MSISWTKNWAGSDDGAILRGIDLRNIQQDIDTHLGGSGTGGYVTIAADQTITGQKTFDDDVILNGGDPTDDTHAARKAYVDGKFNTSTGHDHDGADSKKVGATTLDMTGITSGHFLYNNSGTLAGSAGPAPDVTSDATILLGQANTERTTTTGAPAQKVKEIVCQADGALYISFEIGVGAGVSSARAQVYRNGSAVGTLQTYDTTGPAYDTARTETISGWVVGDLIQLYFYSGDGNTAKVRNFKVYGSWKVNTD